MAYKILGKSEMNSTGKDNLHAELDSNNDDDK